MTSCKLKKQTQPFFPVVFPVCLRNIIFPQNEKKKKIITYRKAPSVSQFVCDFNQNRL